MNRTVRKVEAELLSHVIQLYFIASEQKEREACIAYTSWVAISLGFEDKLKLLMKQVNSEDVAILNRVIELYPFYRSPSELVAKLTGRSNKVGSSFIRRIRHIFEEISLLLADALIGGEFEDFGIQKRDDL